ncbi:hypothetical protein CAEBREN_06701 [Caenorhabditis brenneri]|uniref:Uncharacterized protein n=1 Tax=Caenorhabditis brenneri TaxID=135651 RepID=G0NPC8_CAEBE|nr:hypothetical protein CAEBREN_06701 [Caenorhabditis brenneri]
MCHSAMPSKVFSIYRMLVDWRTHKVRELNEHLLAAGLMRIRHVKGRSRKERRRHSSSDHPSAMVEDKLVTCGGGHRGNIDACNHKFHLSCMMYSRPIARYNSQYLCLKKIMGNLFCHNHACESCFTNKFLRSAHHSSLVRAYHKDCQPAGSTKNSSMVCICLSATDVLTKCETCVQSFHNECNRSHRVKSTEEEKQCEDCMFHWIL